LITYLDVLTKASSNSEIIFAATTPIRTLIRVRFAIRVGGLYTQNIEHFPGDLLLVFYPFEQVPHELLVAFKYAVDVLMQTTNVITSASVRLSSYCWKFSASIPARTTCKQPLLVVLSSRRSRGTSQGDRSGATRSRSRTSRAARTGALADIIA